MIRNRNRFPFHVGFCAGSVNLYDTQVRFWIVVSITRATVRCWPPRPAIARSIRFSSFLACSSLLTVSSVSGSSMPATSTRRFRLLSPRTAASSPRVAMIALADGDPGTLGSTISWPHHENRLGTAWYGSPLSCRWPVTNW